jgi:hypothetical protein
VKRWYKVVTSNFRGEHTYKKLEPLYCYLVFVPKDTVRSVPVLTSLWGETKNGANKNIISLSFPDAETSIVHDSLDCYFFNLNHSSFLHEIENGEILLIKSKTHNRSKMDTTVIADGQEITVKIEKIEGDYYTSYKLYSFRYIQYGGPGPPGPPRTPDNSRFGERVLLSVNDLERIESFENRVSEYAIKNQVFAQFDYGENSIEYKGENINFKSENVFALDLWNSIVGQ